MKQAASIPSQSVSVIIPSLNDASALSCLLKQLVEIDIHEIIVSDGGSLDTTMEVLRAFPTVKTINSPKGRGIQIAHASTFATGDIVWILHADTELPNDPIMAMRTSLSDNHVAMGCFPIHFNECGILYRFYGFMSRIESFWTTFGDQGFFFRRDTFSTLCKDLDMPLFEDVHLRRAAKQLGTIQKMHQPITTSARRLVKNGPIKVQLINMWLLIRYLLGDTPENLAKTYYKTAGPDRKGRSYALRLPSVAKTPSR